MKIGITTYFNIDNYGSALQAFALRNFLTQSGHTAIFLNVKEQHPIDKHLHKLHVASVTAAKCIVNTEARKTLKEIRRLKQATTAVITDETKRMFSEFRAESLPSICIGRRALKKLASSDEYGAFICGSDQIWSPLSPHLSGFKFLCFAPQEKRIAYAPSFGVSKIPSYNRTFIKKCLSGINDISVREFTGAEMIKNLIGREVPVVLDPTMLLCGEEWRKIYQAKVSDKESDQYILCYFFDEPHPEVISKISDFAASKGLKIKVLTASNKGFLAKGAELVDAGPMEFLQLLDQAQYVFTNSFHGCVFSVLFDKKFIAFGRSHSDAVKQTSRIETLLKQVGAGESFYHENQPNFVFPDTERFESAIKPLRETSGEYLLKCLKKRSAR